ncbi:unnamed protein product [Notodromas monacha]|uniref:Uncharacterized protein n=1 Tax=Notodromas monacha TaxID=399045 RepID=A0A7R9C1V4_9CRUS|nr:unnamed protein product [Notodromas monacha]CAG0925389.1 unnamed protein product [Notodromas monacha]
MLGSQSTTDSTTPVFATWTPSLIVHHFAPDRGREAAFESPCVQSVNPAAPQTANCGAYSPRARHPACRVLPVEKSRHGARQQ